MAYEFDDAQGRTAFYDSEGHSLHRDFLRVPVEFKRISSDFGSRFHPILQRWRNHEGIDYEEIKKTFSTPEGTKAFVDATGIDTFAAAIGNLHGKYDVPKQLDLELLAKIRASIDCQISLHGGSGTPLHYFEDASKQGVSKININTDMRVVFRDTLVKVLNDNPDEYAVVKLMPTVYEAVQKVVEEKISAFGSAGKAVR